MNNEDFDVTVFEYLKDKFPGHKLSDYEEASAYLVCKVMIHAHEHIEYYMRKEKRGVRRRRTEGGSDLDE